MARQAPLEAARRVEAAEAAAGDDDVPGHGAARLARAARAASSAGRIRSGSRRRTRHGRAGERVVGHGGEALLVGAQREQQVGDRGPTAAARGSGTRTQKQCTRRPPGTTSSAPASPTSHTPELAALERQAGLALELARLVAEQVAEQALGHRLGALVARPLGRTHARAAEGVQLGDDPGVRERWRSATGAASAARARISTTPAGDERDACRATVQASRAARSARSQRASSRSRQGTARELGERALRDRRISRRRSGGA